MFVRLLTNIDIISWGFVMLVFCGVVLLAFGVIWYMHGRKASVPDGIKSTMNSVVKVCNNSQCIDISQVMNVKPNDLYILHLSDLHISSGGLDAALYRLVEDVKCIIDEKRAKVIVVVTGDIVESCDYSKGNIKQVEDFFQMLLNGLQESATVIAVEIVPGNHEIKRPSFANEFNGGKYRPDSSEYLVLGRHIAGICTAKGIKCGYAVPGVDIIDYCDEQFCFLRVDTSWHNTELGLLAETQREVSRMKECNRPKDDVIKDVVKKRLEELSRISAVYKKRMEKIYRGAIDRCERKGKRVFYTVALSHFPLTWLYSTPAESVRKLIYDKGLVDVNLWLCGHAHNAQLHFTNDDNTSTLMLMTGVGRKISPDTKHRYSLYRLSAERNVIAARVRAIKSSSDSAFKDDEELYSRFRNHGIKYVCFPLKAHSIGTFCGLNNIDKTNARMVLLDGEILDIYRDISLRVGRLHGKFKVEVDKQISMLEYGMLRDTKLKKDIIHRILFPADEKTVVKIDSTWKSECTRISLKWNILADLLNMMTAQMYTVFSEDSDTYSTKILQRYTKMSGFRRISWRIHFRRYENIKEELFNEDNDYYSACTSFGDSIPPRRVPWDGVVSAASMQENKTMIFSVSGVDNPLNTNWSDFITAVPVFPENEKAFCRPHCRRIRPLLTYGISLGYKDYEAGRLASRILYSLELAQINECVSLALNEFMIRTNLNLSEVVLSLKELGGEK